MNEYGEQWDFQNNKKTTEHSDHFSFTATRYINHVLLATLVHWIVTGWLGEQCMGFLKQRRDSGTF
jgi:hypothetical protein